MFENPRRGRKVRNLQQMSRKSSSEQIFSKNCGWVPLIYQKLESLALPPFLACSAGVFFERATRKRHVETSRREEEMRRVKGSGEGAGRERYFFLPSPSFISFFRPRTYRKGYYFYSPQSSTVIKSKMAATTVLPTRTRFRPSKIRLHCRLHHFSYYHFNHSNFISPFNLSVVHMYSFSPFKISPTELH